MANLNTKRMTLGFGMALNVSSVLYKFIFE